MSKQLKKYDIVKIYGKKCQIVDIEGDYVYWRGLTFMSDYEVRKAHKDKIKEWK